AEHEILLPRHAVERLLDFAHQSVIVRRLEIFAREIGLYRDRAHVHERAIEAEHAVHEHRVLVDLLFLDLHEALADRLDVADAGIILLQGGDQAERRGGFSVVLTGGGNENTRGLSIHSRERRGYLFARQMIAGARIEQAVFDCLQPDDRRHAEDVVRGRTAGNVRGRAVEAEQNLPVGIGAGDVLDQFAGDVAGVQVGENEHRRAAGDLAIGQFARGDLGDERGVHLEFAVEISFHAAFLGAFDGHGGGGLHAADGRMRGAPLGGEREQRNARPRAENLPGQLRRRNGDIRELVDGRFGNDAAIRHEEQSALAEARVLDLHDHATRGRGGGGRDLDDLEERAQDAAGDLVRAGDEAVGLVHGHHHRAVVIGQQHRFARLLGTQALGTAQQLETMDEAVEVLALNGVDDANALEGDVEALGGFLDFGAVAEEDGHAQAQGIELARGLEDPGFGAFGEDNPFRVPLQFFEDLPDKSHGGLVAENLGR